MIYVCLLCFLILALCGTSKIPSTINRSVENTGSLCRFSLDWTTFFKVILPFIIVVHHIDHNYEHIFPNGISRIGIILLGNFGILGAIVVGIFFFISGYGLMSSFLRKGDAYFEGFFKKRFAKLLVPFIFVSIVEQVVRSQIVPEYSVMDSFLKFLSSGFFFVQWFVCVLLLFYVFFYFCFKYVKEIKKAALLLLLLVVLLSLFYAYNYTEHWWKSNLCFVIGVFYCMYESAITRKLNGNWKLAISSMAILVILLTIVPRFMPQLDTIKIVILILPVLLIMTTYFFTAPKGRAVDFFSKISYETFLVHSIVLTLFSYVIGFSSTVLTFFAIFVITYILAWITNLVCGKINDLLK